ncbi:MAG: hypothetical protein L0211_21020 [Planctomycetaceae bacterium]|nr:hypothetical protein [Planctomycetaceae bacterium]
MVSKHQFTGMTGLYLVAAELSKRSFIVSPTSRSAHTADLLITDALCQETYAVQVKTNASTFNFWLVSAKTSRIKSKNFVYVFVNLRRNRPEFFIVPSKVVTAKVRVDQPSKTRKTVWYSVYLKNIAQFKDRWDTFKNEAALPVANSDS